MMSCTMVDVFQGIALIGILCLFTDAALIPESDGETKEYEGYKVYEAVPVNEDQIQFFRSLLLTESHIDFWQNPTHPGVKVTFMVPPEFQQSIEYRLGINGIEFKEKISNVNEILKPEAWKRSIQPTNKFDLNDFNRLDKIYEWMRNITSSCKNKEGVKCEVYSIGDSYEGRPILVLKISKPGVSNRKGFWIDATTHAREWLATATLLRIMNQLIMGKDPRTTDLIEKYDWYLAPVLNPDGYEYTFTKDRLWRKNRRPNLPRKCFGTDLNRNFNCSLDNCWGTDGVSHNECSEIYCGPNATSEVETKAIIAEAIRIGPHLLGWTTFHAYGNMLMFPYGIKEKSRCKRAPDHDDLMEVAEIGAKAIEKVFNTKWSRGTTCEVVYPNSGSSSDFVKDFAGVKYSYALELRGNNFIVPKQIISPSFVEIWYGIVAMCDAIARKEGIGNSRSNH